MKDKKVSNGLIDLGCVNYVNNIVDFKCLLLPFHV